MRTFAPIRPNADRDGKTIRVFACPRYVRQSRRHLYVPVEQAAQIVADAQGGFTVTVGGETATLRPLKRREGSLVKTETRPGGRFGWLLNTGAVDDVLDWQLTVSAGGQITDDGAVLADYDGVKLGLSVQDWRGHGLTVDRGTGRVRIDVREAKRLGAVVDLDPQVIMYGMEWSGFHRKATGAGSGQTSWEAARAAQSGSTSPAWRVGLVNQGGAYTLYRMQAAFYMPSLSGTINSALLLVTNTATSANFSPSQVRVSGDVLYNSPTHFHDIGHSFDSSEIGNLAYSGFMNDWQIDVTGWAAQKYAENQWFEPGFCCDQDVDDDWTAASTHPQQYADFADYSTILLLDVSYPGYPEGGFFLPCSASASAKGAI